MFSHWSSTPICLCCAHSTHKHCPRRQAGSVIYAVHDPFLQSEGLARVSQGVPIGIEGVCLPILFFLFVFCCFFFFKVFLWTHFTVGKRREINDRESFLSTLYFKHTKPPLTSVAFFVFLSLFLHKHSYLDRETSLLLRNIAGKPSHLLTKVILLLSTCM